LTSGYGSYGNVEYRVDENRAKTRGFDDSTNNKALGLWRGSQSIPMIKELFSSESLLVRFTPYGESAVSARFPISKIETAIKPLREACNW
ncbi:type VI secretion system-associated protein TagO, partial [Idiomarina sp. Sol25]|uniref:type VI secretion system-associated protein TagO n=1 Tax=Idiomarina sp. Sol25 TaxID=3064000 RepID=UPI00294B2C81